MLDFQPAGSISPQNGREPFILDLIQTGMTGLNHKMPAVLCNPDGTADKISAGESYLTKKNTRCPEIADHPGCFTQIDFKNRKRRPEINARLRIPVNPELSLACLCDIPRRVEQPRVSGKFTVGLRDCDNPPSQERIILNEPFQRGLVLAILRRNKSHHFKIRVLGAFMQRVQDFGHGDLLTALPGHRDRRGIFRDRLRLR
ncbi:MAG: hypothetical protein BWY49_00428 [Candidatus Omnitrophica bacterium ADurb.Bin314]|nr:MAG: hypothetical protein BWY49_00428 [Candidatus Omnitrophica bacterium ADurb.Bin314]